MEFSSNNYDQKKTGTRFPVSSSNSNVTLSSVTYIKAEDCNSKNGAINFTFEKDGAIINHKRFLPDLDNVQQRDGETLDQAKERSFKSFNAILQHIGNKFTDNVTTGNNLIEYVKNWCGMMSKAVVGHKVYLKTILNNNGYTDLPKYPDFIQNMNSGECTLLYTDKEREANAQNEESRKARMAGSSATPIVPGVGVPSAWS